MNNNAFRAEYIGQPHDRRRFLRSCVQGLAAAALGPALSPLFRAQGAPLSPSATALFYNDEFLLHNHSYEVPQRLRSIMQALGTAGLLESCARITPTLTDALSVKPRITAIHSSAHAEAIAQLAVTGPVAELAAATALQATRLVHEGSARNAFCAIRPPGHHVVNKGGEEGFCFLANVAIAARYIQDVLGHERVLIIDWDFHHGNGTQYFFYDDPTVLFCSTHQCGYYPGRFCNSYTYKEEVIQIGSDESCRGIGPGEGFNINIDMPCGAVTQDFLNAWQERLLPKVATFKPDFILISAGFDSKANDSLGCFSITPDGFAQMTQVVMDLAAHYCDNRLVSLLEGGYANRSSGTYDDLGSCVAAHVQALATYQPTPTRRPSALAKPSGLPLVRQQGNLLVIDGGQQGMPHHVSIVNLRGQLVGNAQLGRGAPTISLAPLSIAPGHYLVQLFFASSTHPTTVAVHIVPFR